MSKEEAAANSLLHSDINPGRMKNMSQNKSSKKSTMARIICLVVAGVMALSVILMTVLK